jgi:Protein of unknown function (DUF2971)
MRPVWAKREKLTVHISSPTGETAQIRPIDPEFWAYDGNIEIGKYIAEHEQYLARQREKDETVYHYTSLEALHRIVRDGVIWASDIRQLNDRFEIRYALDRMHALLVQEMGTKIGQQPLNAIFRSGVTWQFVSCLSLARDQLSQWRAYGNKVGIAIAFDRKHLKHAAEALKGNLVECRYFGPKDFSVIRDDLEPIVQALMAPDALNKDGVLTDMDLENGLTKRVVQIATSIKHPSFAEEREIRLVFPLDKVSEAMEFRSSPQNLVPFIKVDIDGRRTGMQKPRPFANHLGITETIVWPNNVDDQILDAINMLFASVGHVVINRSISPYRT